MLTENIVPVFPCRDKANDGDLAGNVLRQSEAGFTSCGVAVKAEEYLSLIHIFLHSGKLLLPEIGQGFADCL